MAPAYTQTDRLLKVVSPLGTDVLLALGLHGGEGLSQLYRFTVDVMAVRTAAVAFDAVMGLPFAVHLQLPDRKKYRYFHGICVQFSQGQSDRDFTYFQMEMVPRVWTLTKRAQSRIFQQMTVPAILKKVFDGFDMEYQLHGKYEPRDYCVQYRETDFNFASRLMEEEGIYYYFKHDEKKHTMVLGDTPQTHAGVPGEGKVLYRGPESATARAEDYISEVVKVQAQTAGKFTFRDHTFELVQGRHDPNHVDKVLTETVTVGKVAHKLRVGDTARMEVYDWPGEYAQRFDGMDTGGQPAAKEVPKITPTGKQTAEVRMQAEAATAVRVQGGGAARQLKAGHKFTLTTVPADPTTTPVKLEGDYVLTSVQHAAAVGAGNYTSGSGESSYTNTFTAIPADLPFRPQRTTPKPVVPGSQSAQVVGPPGEEIFTDPYGRVKVHFHWDRDQDPAKGNTSCWIRVAQMAAGRGWGSFSLPRVGQEVIVDFLEGDPDQPIVVGCVFNPDQAQKYKLPDEKTKTWIRTNSSPGGVGYNALRFEDKGGQEQIYVHAQKDLDERVRNDTKERVGMDRHLRVGFYLPNDHKGDVSGESKKGSQFEEVAVDQHLKVWKDKQEHVGGDLKLLVGGGDGDGHVDVHIKATKKELVDGTSDLHVKGAVREKLGSTFDQRVKDAVKQTYGATADLTVTGKRTETVGGADLHVKGDQKEKVDGTLSQKLGANFQQKVGQNHAVDAGQEIHLKAGMKVIIEAGTQISLKVGGNFIDIGPAGVTIFGTMVLINSGGSAGSGSGAKPDAPADAKEAAEAKDAKDAQPTKPKDADYSKTGDKSN